MRPIHLISITALVIIFPLAVLGWLIALPLLLLVVPLIIIWILICMLIIDYTEHHKNSEE